MDLTSIWKDIWRTRAKTWTYSEIPGNKTPEGLGQSVVAAESAYLNVWLTSFRITDVRKGLKKFYGTVHSFITLPVLGDQKADFQVVTTPGQLQKIDAENVDPIIVLDQRLLGPIPYRGGDLALEIGLFSIKEADLTAPFLSVLESMSKTGGVSFITTALPFAGPIRDGINLLAGANGDSVLEIGLSKPYNPVKIGYFVVMRAEQGEVDRNKFRIDQNHQLVDDATGVKIENFPYLVFRIDATSQRDDWYQIPELKSAYASLQDVIRKGQNTQVDDAFAVFRRIALTCPDLLLADAGRLVKKINDEVAAIVGPTRTSFAAGRTIRPLNEVDLYG